MMHKEELLNEYAELFSAKRRTGIQDLPELWRATYGRSVLYPDGSPTPSGLNLAQRKRIRTTSRIAIPPELAKAQRLEDIWRSCSSILMKRLWQSTNAPPFQQPVDPIRLGIPDYFNYVSHPMDLLTIKEKLANLNYSSPLEFRDDVRQVWLNCTLYNHPNTPVRVMGDALSDSWERAWLESNVEAAWRDFQMRYNSNGNTENEPLDSKRNSSSGKVQEGAQAEQGLEVPSAATSREGTPNPLPLSQIPISEPPLNQPDEATIAFIQRRKLAHWMAEIFGEHLQSILDLVQMHEPELICEPSDPEQQTMLDLDLLRPETLTAIQRYADRLPSQAGPRWPQGPAKTVNEPSSLTAMRSMPLPQFTRACNSFFATVASPVSCRGEPSSNIIASPHFTSSTFMSPVMGQVDGLASAAAAAACSSKDTSTAGSATAVQLVTASRPVGQAVKFGDLGKPSAASSACAAPSILVENLPQVAPLQCQAVPSPAAVYALPHVSPHVSTELRMSPGAIERNAPVDDVALSCGVSALENDQQLLLKMHHHERYGDDSAGLLSTEAGAEFKGDEEGVACLPSSLPNGHDQVASLAQDREDVRNGVFSLEASGTKRAPGGEETMKLTDSMVTAVEDKEGTASIQQSQGHLGRAGERAAVIARPSERVESFGANNHAMT
ncbi:hypothetical protein CEUSTIGMA_g5239.t1 [Chlamydomonas eustigma]|uniref:Bromo domain-containing protein n=1 Tax=Chlamydomonas eustigma TaxID=1157962 RepID=A0A250X415_9CHLO|nr:hypothetical protein CEUSTIGMA_g5239.t1 [Chlamydomonas eustigma]|eukprot:GAX77796.1 hypothetical protein CEUSTIGMA_g5239.t1 [Chlamydomonas eustigma]